MRIESGNDYGPVRSNVVECEAAPWIDDVTFCDAGAVDLWIGRPEPIKPTTLHVIFTKEEWPIIKARVDAAFAGTDPNLSEFYASPSSA